MLLKDLYREAHKKLSYQLGAGEARARLEILLEDMFGISRNHILMNPDREFTKEQLEKWQILTERLLNNEPVQYLCGSASFFGLQFKVTPAVLIPRPETEELVEMALEKITQNFSGKIIDIGTGSGCIAISTAKNHQQGKYYAIDTSKEALLIAKENAKKNDVNIEFIQQNFLDTSLWNKLPKFDVILSNPPYVTVDEWESLEDEVKSFEPEIALHPPDGESPLIFYSRIADFAIGHLTPGGFLLLEINEQKGDEVLKCFSKSYFSDQIIIKDINGKDRFFYATKYM